MSRPLVYVALPLIGCASLTHAQTVEWAEPTSGSWLDPIRWSTGAVPTMNDNVLIAATSSEGYNVSDAAGSIASLSVRTDATVQLEIGGSLSLASDLLLTDGGDIILVNRDTTFSVGGNATIEPGSSLVLWGFNGGHDVHIAGNVTNRGVIGQRGGTLAPINRMTIGGRLVNEASGLIWTDYWDFEVEAELENKGRVQVGAPLSISSVGAAHLNSGTIDLVFSGSPTNPALSLVGESFINTGFIGTPSNPPDSHRDSFVDAAGMAVRNEGTWASGLTADTIDMTETSSWLLDITNADHPQLPDSDLISASTSVTLNGALEIQFFELPIPPSPGLPDILPVASDYVLVTAPSITGAFDSWSIAGLPSGFDAELVYSETAVTLRVIPAPGAAVLLVGGTLPALTRRRR